MSETGHTFNDPNLLARRLERERRARMEAERLLEDKSRELHLANQSLERLNAELESRVNERTQQLEKARRVATEASAAKSDFFARMSHEIRTPLNGVIAASSLLRDQLADQSHLSLIDTIGSSAELLLSLVNDVLDFSQIEAGKLELIPAPFDLPQLVRQCGNLFAPTAQAKGLNLEIDCQLATSRFAIGDSLRLKQVLVNLLGNAIKFTAAGRIWLSVREVTTEVGLPARYEFKVGDTGMGLDAEQQAKLFQPYTQVGYQSKDRAGGSGLGLVTCERLVTLAGGRLQIQSVPAQGTTFSFTLPLADAPVAAGCQAPDALFIPRDNRSLRIVIADDTKINIQLLKLVLERMGHTVTAYLTALEAIAHISTQPTDLAIFDLCLAAKDKLLLNFLFFKLLLIIFI